MARHLLLSVLTASLTFSGLSQDVMFEAGTDGVESVTDHPLIQAAISNEIGVIREQINAGEDLNVQNEHGWTPLIYAVEHGHNDAFHVLVDAGANVNFQEKDGWTALMFAAYHGDSHMVDMILEVGGDPLILNNAGYAAHSIAQNNDHADVAKHIAEQAMVQSMSNDDLHSAISLIREGASVNHRNSNGWTVLALASSMNAVEDVETLVQELSADVNLPENDGWTPLMFAANNNFQAVAKVLLNHGAQVDYRTASGVGAVTLAQDEGYPDMVELLNSHATSSSSSSSSAQPEATAAAAATVDVTRAEPKEAAPAAAVAEKKKGMFGF